MESLQFGRSINDLSVGILVFNSQLKVVAENQGSRQLFGGISLMGKSLFELNGSLEFNNSLEFNSGTFTRNGHYPLQLSAETPQYAEDAALVVQVSASEHKERLLLKASPWFQDDENIPYAIDSLQDVASVNHSEKDSSLHMLSAVLRAKQEWITTVDAIADMIILEDANGQLLRCNKAAATFFQLHT